MRVGIDCQTLAAGARHGFATYLGNLLQALRQRYPEHEFVEWPCVRGPGWRMPNQLWWDQVRVPWSAFRARVDIMHTPAFSGPLLIRKRVVMTVMDLMYTRYPEWLPTSRARWYWGRWIPFTARHAAAVIAPSRATKCDLVQLAGVKEDRITVIPLAVDPLFEQRPPRAEVEGYRARLGLTGPYVLFVGQIDQRKDLDGLVHAYARVRAKLKDLRLVIAGQRIRGHSALGTTIQALGLTKEVLLPGHIPDDQLRLLYAGASLFVYPSRWEGFGLPPLEAMAMGVPVITYRCSSLPELVDDAAILVDPPFTVEALESAMIQVLLDGSTRADLIARGSQRVSAFTWERAAEQTMWVYEQCSKVTRTGIPIQCED